MKNPYLQILVVDDQSTIRTILKSQLRHMGFTKIAEASDGESAFDIMKTQNIDLVISDWNMPYMTGYELLKAVRADDSLAATPFILTSGAASNDNINMALQLKVDQFMIKPFTLAVLEEKINQVIH
ncbi:MAG: response regulator [Proteobacteria bacterium]|nr:response regulator [Pseudomonadota bacterium]MBU1640753.1 response regulator [Pseudomonadota bacterium]